MEIIDRNNFTIEVTDLSMAIRWTEKMIARCPVDGVRTDFEENRLAYFEDLKKKLENVKT